MPRQSKSTKTEVAETTPAVNTASVEKTAKPKKETKPKAAKTETPVVAAAPATETPVVAADAAEVDVADLAAQSAEFFSKINQLSTLLASLKTEYRSLEKKWSREIKAAQKSQAKRKRKSGNRQPSGFVKPTKISDELAKFLEKPVGSEMARTDVTREINKYIRSHNLQDKENGRKINPDAKLQTLLKLKKTDELTYFNLQRYMSPHFSKAEKAATTA
jgi:chromatin remodeling complex protein RSC6